jgi:hypothetical protein
MWKIEKDAVAEYLERRRDYPDEDCHDVIHEVADSNVPIYTSDLMLLAAEDIDLAVGEPECGPAFDGKPTPVNIIAANVYERIRAALYQAEDEKKNGTAD